MPFAQYLADLVVQVRLDIVHRYKLRETASASEYSPQRIVQG